GKSLMSARTASLHTRPRITCIAQLGQRKQTVTMPLLRQHNGKSGVLLPGARCCCTALAPRGPQSRRPPGAYLCVARIAARALEYLVVTSAIWPRTSVTDLPSSFAICDIEEPERSPSRRISSSAGDHWRSCSFVLFIVS